MSKKLRAPRPKHLRKDAVYSKEARILDEKPQLIDGYKDPAKVFHAGVDKAIREKIARMKQKFSLPESITSYVHSKVSDVLVINRDAQPRELLPDIPSRHVMLCHRSLARVIESGVGIFSKITTAPDGSWVLCPAAVSMLNQTTVQHVRRRSFWFLRRYSYEISFDGRVEPAMMFYDYGLDPSRTKQRFYVTNEMVPIRDTDKFNTFFRFWLKRSAINSENS